MTKLKIIVTCEECEKVDVFYEEGEAKTYGWEFIEDNYNRINYWLCDKCSHDWQVWTNANLANQE